MRYLKEILLILILIEVILTGTFVFGETEDTYCVVGESLCSDVQNSKYGNIFGIGVGELGFYAFSFMFIFGIYLFYFDNHYYKYFHFMFLVGFLLAVYFLSLQFFVLEKVCSICMFIDWLMILIFALVISGRKNFLKTSKSL
jgi:uncharacterized membrane protein|tara:strand:+ start:1487 stop:1912 length:426 start_codon:yes stop_codon:yes gene_type:complete